ncbi:Protein of unknown function [Lactobacillus delbrueckii subsp. bulgaricus]|nr:Protein of unknown function [Lactobacillus delbrueckii subsp. bulgaricus]
MKVGILSMQQLLDYHWQVIIYGLNI